MNKVADRLKGQNIAEYLLYMWGQEDLIRANDCDSDMLERYVVSRYPESERQGLIQWYGDLLGMMRQEGVCEHGHLRVNENILIHLTDLHHALLSCALYPYYHSAYFKALPYITELKQKNGMPGKTELVTCFEALYGVLLLKLRHKAISEGTQKAIDAISGMISMLAKYYPPYQRGELKTD